MNSTSATSRSLLAGALYFVLVFAIAFLLGTIRFLVIVPRVGDFVGVLIELAILLPLAWVICARVMIRSRVPHRPAPRLIVSASAFLLLLSTEFVLSFWLFGTSVDAYFGSFGTPHGAFGLAGQVAFALFPVVQLLTPPKP